MSRWILPTLLACSLLVPSHADEYTPPAVKIVAPQKVKPGRMVVVRVDMGPSPPNVISTRSRWTVLVNGVPAADLLPWPDGKMMVFQASEEQSVTTVMLNVDYLFGVKKKAKVDEKDQDVFLNVQMKSPEVAAAAIVVGDIQPPAPGPGPSPGPTPPGPTPGPIFPDGKFGLAPLTYQILMADTMLVATDKAKLAKALSAAFLGVAGNIVAVATYPKDVDSILPLAKKATQDAIAASGVPLASTAAFKKALGDKVYTMIYGDTPQIATGADLAQAYRELSQGLDQVR